MAVAAGAYNRYNIFRENCEEIVAVGQSVGDHMAGYRRGRLDVGREEEEFMRDVFLRDDPKKGREK